MQRDGCQPPGVRMMWFPVFWRLGFSLNGASKEYNEVRLWRHYLLLKMTEKQMKRFASI